MTSLTLITVGTIVGTVTLNPIVLGVVTGSGVIIQGYLTKSNISSKVDHCKFAYTNYNKIIIQLRSYLRGMPFNEEIFISDAKVIEDIVIDMCPSINGMSAKYNKIYGAVS